MTPDTEYGMSKFTITSDGARRSMRGSPVLANCVEAGFTLGGGRPRADADAGPGPQGVVALAFSRRKPAPVHADDFQLRGARIFQRHVAHRRARAIGEIRERRLEVLEVLDFLAVEGADQARRAGMPALPKT